MYAHHLGVSLVPVYDMGFFRVTGKSICCYPVHGGESILPNLEEAQAWYLGAVKHIAE